MPDEYVPAPGFSPSGVPVDYAAEELIATDEFCQACGQGIHTGSCTASPHPGFTCGEGWFVCSVSHSANTVDLIADTP